MMKTVAFNGSPRPTGNTTHLLDSFIAGAKKHHAEAELLHPQKMNLEYCTGCLRCNMLRRCSISDDDWPELSSKILDADRLIFATPVFFMTVCAQAKALIDRCQCLWVRKYVLKKPLFTEQRDRRAMVIAVGGSRSKDMFHSIRLTMKYYLDALEMQYAANLFVNQVDELGKIKQHQPALEQAYRLGRELITSTEPVPKKPVDTILT